MQTLTNTQLEEVSGGVVPAVLYIAYGVGVLAGMAYGAWLAN